MLHFYVLLLDRSPRMISGRHMEVPQGVEAIILVPLRG